MKLRPHSVLRHVGSLRAALALMALLAAVVLAGAVTDRVFTLAIGLVCLLMAVQLLLSLRTDPRLRRRLPLLLFHLGLLALVLEVGLSRLVSLDGRFELTEGLPFDGRLIDGRQGPLVGDGLQRLAFSHQGFEIDYAPGRRRGATRNRVTWVDEGGRPQQGVIGDHRPLVLHGHRITTTPNKGFAPVLRWWPDQGEPVTGAVHLPSFPALEHHQSREWPLPDGRAAWVLLDHDETLIDPSAAAQFRRPAQHRLVLRIGPLREVLTPGSRVAVPGGAVEYVELRTWMGYRIHHDPLLPWLLGTALVATAALAWSYAVRFRATPLRAARPVSWRSGVEHA